MPQPIQDPVAHIDSTEHLLSQFIRIWSVCALVLFGLTWLLWLGNHRLPQIPFFEFLTPVPRILDPFFTAAIFGSLLGCLFGTQTTQKRALTIFACALCSLILLDQNRLQPWAYQFAIYAVLLSTLSTSEAVGSIRWVAISIYIFSAISKLDYQFVHTVGAQMVSTIENGIGFSLPFEPETKRIASLALPLFEMAAGVLLIFRRTRFLGMISVTLMHVGLLGILGPWGLDHAYPVLVWNVFFIIQAVYLFGILDQKQALAAAESIAPKSDKHEPLSRPRRWPISWLGKLTAVATIVFPLTQPLGICDHWPAWQVYAPRTSRVEMANSFDDGELLIGIPYTFPTHDLFIGVPRGDLNALSIQEVGVPVYPQARFQLAMLIAIEQLRQQEKYQPILSGYNRVISVELQSESDPITGHRKIESLTGLDQMKMKASRYWLNTKPRVFAATKPEV